MARGDKNRAIKLKELQDKGKSELLPPSIEDTKLSLPSDLSTIEGIEAEYRRIYRMVFKQQIQLADATRLAYFLDRMIQAKKARLEIDTINSQYANAWSGVSIITE